MATASPKTASVHLGKSSDSPSAERGNKLILAHLCGGYAEPLSRYIPGGFHPVTLGDTLDNERYEILRKVGYGGFSTVWAARDRRENRNVALKIMAARVDRPGSEAGILKKLALRDLRSQRDSKFLQVLDVFQVTGPNGTHDCLVLELLGPSIVDYCKDRAEKDRIPAKLVKRIAKEVTQGIDYLHRQGIVHGDLHTRNISFSAAFLRDLPVNDLVKALGDCEADEVTRKDGKPLSPYMIKVLTEPAEFTAYDRVEDNLIKISDFGEAFIEEDPPPTLHTPISVRPPEVIFGDRLDHRVDLWSLGCLIFELIAGNPPFNSLMAEPHDVVQEMLESIQPKLPVRWRGAYKSMKGEDPDPEGPTLQAYLERCYFDADKQQDFTREDLKQVGELIGKLMKLEPSERIEAGELLKDTWWDSSP